MTVKMHIEQSVGSYPTLRRTVTADISPRSGDFSGSVIVSPAVDIDHSCSRRSFQTFILIIVKCLCNAVSMKCHYDFFSFVIGLNEMIGLYVVPTRLGTTNQLSTNQLSHAVNPINQTQNSEKG